MFAAEAQGPQTCPPSTCPPSIMSVGRRVVLDARRGSEGSGCVAIVRSVTKSSLVGLLRSSPTLRRFGVEAAWVALGHQSVAVTEIYAEPDRALARGAGAGGGIDAPVVGDLAMALASALVQLNIFVINPVA